MPHKKHLTPEQLDAEHKIDDRWTETKLLAAGYEQRGEGPCDTCGQPIAFYKREKATDYKGTPKWQVLDAGTLAKHECRRR
jgi:hypothetical protein